MKLSRVEIIDGEEYIKLDFAMDILKEEKERKGNLIEYLEDKIKGLNKVIEIKRYEEDEESISYLLTKRIAYQDILERVKRNSNENTK